MVVYFGLNDKVGNVSFYDSSGQQEYSFQKPYSEKTAQLIDSEISKLVELAYKRAVKLVAENKDKVEKLAKLLLEKEVIFREDLESVFGERPFDEEKKRIEQEAEEEMHKLKANNSKRKTKAKTDTKALPKEKSTVKETKDSVKKVEKTKDSQPEPSKG